MLVQFIRTLGRNDALKLGVANLGECVEGATVKVDDEAGRKLLYMGVVSLLQSSKPEPITAPANEPAITAPADAPLKGFAGKKGGVTNG